jgi:hypothetical protein
MSEALPITELYLESAYDCCPEASIVDKIREALSGGEV